MGVPIQVLLNELKDLGVDYTSYITDPQASVCHIEISSKQLGDDKDSNTLFLITEQDRHQYCHAIMLQSEANEQERIAHHLQHLLLELMNIQLSFFKIASDNNGVTKITETLSDLLQLPVRIIDPSLKILASSQLTPHYKKIWLAGSQSGFVDVDPSLFPILQNYLQLCRDKDDFFQFSWTSDGILVSILSCPVQRDKRYGMLSVDNSLRQISQKEHYIIRCASNAIASVLERLERETFRDSESSYLLYYLLSGPSDNSAIICKQFAQLNLSLPPHFFLLNIHPYADNYIRRDRLESWAANLNITLSSIAFCYYQGNLVYWMSQEKWTKSTEHWLRMQLEAQKCYAVCSALGKTPTQIPALYEQCIYVANKEENSSLIAYFDDYRFTYMLDVLRKDKQRSFFQSKELDLLQTYDQDNNNDYVVTLKSFLANNLSRTRTAAALHIHRSTLDYRLGRIEEILEISLEDNEKLFHMALSLLLEN